MAFIVATVSHSGRATRYQPVTQPFASTLNPRFDGSKSDGMTGGKIGLSGLLQVNLGQYYSISIRHI
ncbi:hypothetical protein L6172_00600 [Thalassospiraceae bacterium SW-3-3]|nr:hypothetical protein L6172_00600 [Thalassospiraceae bacterium SW-3-3]